MINDDPNRLMLNEKSAVEVGQKQLSKEREEELILAQLRAEFARIDVSGDGLVTFDELRTVLGPRADVAEQIFQELDLDNSGAVSLQEFVETYFVKQRLVTERLAELEHGLKAHHKSREQLLLKLAEQKQKERVNAYGLDLDAILTVRVVEARDLMPMDLNGKSDPYVVLKLGNMQM